MDRKITMKVSVTVCKYYQKIKHKNMAKDLKEKAISIKGKQYVMVADRILYFNEKYPLGSISTTLLSDSNSDKIVVKATIDLPMLDEDGEFMKDGHGAVGQRTFTGHSQATVGDGMVNKTAALENAETSAVGRALAMMGIGVIESIASVDEMNKAGVMSAGATPPSDHICSVCKTDKLAMSYKKDPKGVLYCPELCWKKDKSYQIIPKPSENDEIFDKSLDESKDVIDYGIE